MVGAIGAGMNFVEPLRRVVAEADVDVVMVAGRYTLLDRSASTLLEDCHARNVSVVAAAPFNSGLLARPWPSASARFDYEPVTASVLERARNYATICMKHGAELPQVALQFPLRHPDVACVVVGMGSAAHVEGTVSWASHPASGSCVRDRRNVPQSSPVSTSPMESRTAGRTLAPDQPGFGDVREHGLGSTVGIVGGNSFVDPPMAEVRRGAPALLSACPCNARC